MFIRETAHPSASVFDINLILFFYTDGARQRCQNFALQHSPFRFNIQNICFLSHTELTDDKITDYFNYDYLTVNFLRETERERGREGRERQMILHSMWTHIKRDAYDDMKCPED